MGEAKRRAGNWNANAIDTAVRTIDAQTVSMFRYGHIIAPQRLQASLDALSAQGKARAAVEAERKAKAKRSEAARKAAATRKAKRAAQLAVEYGVNDGKRIDGVGNLF